jgi:hypothetical protein
VESLAAVRARLGEGTEAIGDCRVPVRTVEFEGDPLAARVLMHVWDRHHALRTPLLRWLSALAENPRTASWMRAAVALGALAARDFSRVYHESILPQALSNRLRGQLIAATALDQASQNDLLRPAIRSLMRDWARNGNASQCTTAAFVHGYGRVAGSVAESVTELRRIAERPGQDAAACHSLLLLLGGTEPGTVLDRILAWARSPVRSRADLGLLLALRMSASRVGDVRDPDGGCADLAGHAKWPTALGLVAARPELADRIVDAVALALRTDRTAAAQTQAIGGWLRESAEDARMLRALLSFLPRLFDVCDGVADRLARLVGELADDPDEPLPASIALRLDRMLRTGVGGRHHAADDER